MNMNLETMIGKIKCSGEKELHVNLFEIHMEPLEKCLGYALSILDAIFLRAQKLFFGDWASANVPKTWKDVKPRLFALNVITVVILQQSQIFNFSVILEAGISCFQKLCDVAQDYHHVESLLTLLGEIERPLLLCRRVLFPCFILELVKGDHQLQLFLPYVTVFVMGEAFTSLELLQHEYQFDSVYVMAVVASAIIQLQLNEATESYKRMDKLLRAFGICISFNHLANHHSSNGPQVLIEQLVDIEFSVDLFEATMVPWLANYDEGPNSQGAKRTRTWFIKMHGFHHISTNKVLQQHTCLQRLQLVLRKLIQAKTQVSISILRQSYSDSSHLVWPFNVKESEFLVKVPEAQGLYVYNMKYLRELAQVFDIKGQMEFVDYMSTI